MSRFRETKLQVVENDVYLLHFILFFNNLAHISHTQINHLGRKPSKR